MQTTPTLKTHWSYWNDMRKTTEDIIREQNRRIQRDLLRQKPHLDNNKIIGVIFAVILTMALI